ncbi:MAG: NAD-binding protein [Firmicutes bacterium]|nr:NAD-binding protein [Bacillota bacterium]
MIVSLLRRLNLIIKSNSNYKTILIVIFTLVISGSVLIYLIENRVNPQFAGLSDGLWWSVVTITTVGYGDKYPVTGWGKLVAFVVMIGGIGSFGYLAGSIIEDLIKRGRGEMAVNFKNHIVICDYNHKVEDIYREIQKEIKNSDIVLVANREENPAKDLKNIFFVKGDTTKAEVLEKANVSQAATVIVLGDSELEDQLADAHSVLTTLAVRNLNSACKIIAEVLSTDNTEHFQRAGANEIICIGELAGQLIVRSSLYTGLSNMIGELVTNRFGNELYSEKISQDLEGVEFGDAFIRLKKLGATIMGVYSDNQLSTNPDMGLRLKKDDYLIYMAREPINK